MTEVAFASLCEQFRGSTGWVVGRGPTRFDYALLAREPGPFFFVNDAVGAERWLRPGAPSFFFAHDASMAAWLLDPGLRSVPVLVTDQPVTGPREQPVEGLLRGRDDPHLAGVARAVFYRKQGPHERTSLLERSRVEIRDSGQLYTASGTLHPLLHFAWYVGCRRLRMVGCDGFPGIGYDARLENRSGSTQQAAIFIRVRQEEILRRLGLPSEHVGTIPHRIRMILELRVRPENRARLLAWSDKFLDLLREHGCTELLVNDWVASARGYWVNGTWPGIDACVGCLASERYKAATLEGRVLADCDPESGYRTSFLAVRP